MNTSKGHRLYFCTQTFGLFIRLYIHESYVFKNFYVSLGTTTSCICLLEIRRFASSVPVKCDRDGLNS